MKMAARRVGWYHTGRPDDDGLKKNLVEAQGIEP
jgi:hypothetical protein